MLSRVAEALYWLARYLERAEDTARLINASTHLHLDRPGGVPIQWDSLVEILGSWESFDRAAHAEPDERTVTRFLIDDPHHGSSIHASVRHARENARTVREMLPTEVWEGINELYFLVRDSQGNTAGRRRRFEFLRRVIASCQQITGVVEGTLAQAAPYHVLSLGRCLERADMTSRIIDVRAASLMAAPADGASEAWDDAGWMSVLRSLGGYMMYRQYMTPRIQGPDVVHFLVLDETFPRAIRFCLQCMSVALRALPRSDTALDPVGRLEQTLGRHSPGNLELPDLHQYIDDLQLGLASVHDAVAESYFPSP